jgi:hypothetical protein
MGGTSRLVIVLVEKGPKPDVDVVKRGEQGQVIEHGLAGRSSYRRVLGVSGAMAG